VKASVPNQNRVAPMPKRTRINQVHPSRIYHQQQVRQRRMLLVALVAIILVIVSGVAVWGVCQTIPRFIQPIALNSKQFEGMLEQDFGLFETPSLLYYHTMDYAVLSHQPLGLLEHKLTPLLPASEDTELKSQLEQLFAQYPASRFTPHFYFYNPQDGRFVAINGYAPVPAASVIKLPILLDYLMTVDEGLVKVDTPWLYAEFHRAGGSGDLQYKPTGQGLSANDVAGQMIRISDNTCTNMMISYLGGTDAVNQRLADLGLVNTRIRNWLPDLEGTNTISPYEMVTIMNNIDHGPLVSELSRYNGLSILKSTHNRHLLVAPLPKDVVVAHKTGDIGTALGDSGAVYLPDGRKYFVSMQVERPYNDYTARDMVQRASRLIYDYVNAQPPPQPTSGLPPEQEAPAGI
jgi:beta-lactamase class A